jgi:serine/threonine-protein kinase
MSRDDLTTDLIERATEPVVEDVVERVAAAREDHTGDPAPSPPPDRYKVINRLGKGGMGEVMAVRDTTIGREVALKRIRKAEPTEVAVQRFLREATIQARLDHPAIVPVHDIGSDDVGRPFFTMKKLAGITLAKILDGKHDGYPPQRLLRAFVDVCLAVEFAHVRGIIHRDLKPENIVLGDFGEVYVLDWGVAKIVGEHDPDFSDVSGSGEHATQVGASIGTPGYMSPEQIRGVADLDARTDVYALGCVLFEILSGQMLHPTGQAGLSSAMAGGDTRPSARVPWRDIPPELDRLCADATSPDRDARVPTARALCDGVQRYLDGDRDLARRRELGREHLDRARAAFAAVTAGVPGADAERRVAMREAAAALALDPQLAGAAELVGRLMIEPPRQLPAEVEQLIRDDDATTRQGHARSGVISFGAFLAFMPLVWWIAPSGSPYLIALVVMVLVCLGLCMWGTTKKTYGKEGLLAVANAVLLGIVSRMFTPFLIAPGLAAMSTMAILFTPTTSRLTSTVVLTVMAWLAVLAPYLLELFGVVSATTTVISDGTLMLRVAGSAGEAGPTISIAVIYVMAMIATAAWMATTMRERARAARRHLHVQAWQLRQLVPH